MINIERLGHDLCMGTKLLLKSNFPVLSVLEFRERYCYGYKLDLQ